MCGKGSNTQTQTTAPPPQVAAAYNSLMERAQGVSEQPYTPYTGDRVADLTPEQLASMGQIQGMGNIAQPYISEGAGYMRDSANPVTQQALQPYMNPYQQSVIDATLARTQQADAQAQNQVTGNAALRGALGGDRMGIAQAELAGQQKLARDQLVSGLNKDNYTQALAAWQAEQARKAQAGFGISQLGTVAQNAEMQRLAAALGIGDKQQQQNQAELNVPYQDFLEQRAYPFQTSQWLASILGSTTPALGSTTTTTGPKPSPLNALIGAGTTALGVFTGNPFLVGAGATGMANGAGALATGGRVGYAEGGPIMPFNPAAVPMNLGVGYVPASQIRPMQMPRPAQMPQEAPEDPGMSRMTNNFVAAMKAMREKSHDGLSDYQATNSDGAHAHGGRVGYADGGEVFLPEGLYPAPMNRATPSLDYYQPDLAPLDSNWNPAYAGEENSPQLKPSNWQTSTRPAPTALTPAPQITDEGGVRGPARSNQWAPSTWNWDSLRMPLITAGLGMMASKSPFPMQAVGEGGLMGVQTYMTQEQQARANELKKRQIELQSQRLADAAERARQTLDFNREKQGDLNDYRDRSLTVRQNTSKQGAVEHLAERVATELNIPFSQALERVRASNKDPQTMLSLERLALQAAKADDLAYKNDPKATLSKWRKDYGLPDKPMVLKGFDTPNPNSPTEPVTYPGGRTKEQLIKDTQAFVKANPKEKEAKKEDLKRYGIDPSVLDQ